MTIILIFLLLLYTSICAVSYTSAISSDIADSVLRLHVLANSDSQEDQNLKYIVRDKLLEYMKTLCDDITSKSEAIEQATEHLEDLKTIAKQTIIDQGYSYDVNVEIGNFEFPTKTYGDIAFPAGNYDAVRVKIGEAKGQNWWCVMFPPLCFIDVTSGVVPDESKSILQESMSEEDFALVSENKSNKMISFKFKILEFFGKNGFITAKK